MRFAGLEPAIPVNERPQTRALDRTATGKQIWTLGTEICLNFYVKREWVDFHRTQACSTNFCKEILTEFHENPMKPSLAAIWFLAGRRTVGTKHIFSAQGVLYFHLLKND
jgi:hypothetical protein